MVADEVRWLGDEGARAAGRATSGSGRPTRLRTFEDVETLWETVVRPRLQEFRTMQQHPEGREEPAEGSVWRANWRIPERW